MIYTITNDDRKYISRMYSLFGNNAMLNLDQIDDLIESLPDDYGNVMLSVNGINATIKDSKLLDKFLKKV